MDVDKHHEVSIEINQVVSIGQIPKNAKNSKSVGRAISADGLPWGSNQLSFTLIHIGIERSIICLCYDNIKSAAVKNCVIYPT